MGSPGSPRHRLNGRTRAAATSPEVRPLCVECSPHIIDLHVHTTLHSFDSGLSARRMIDRCLALGFSTICTTEHNSIWTPIQAREAYERFGITVLRGMEINTDVGHVLVFGVDGYRLEMMQVDRLRAIVEREGGAMILAHPTRNAGFGRPWSEAEHLFEALEGMNGDDHNLSSEYVIDIARSLGLAATGGSDAHSVPAVGRCATVFAEPIRNEQQLIAALRGGSCFPVDLTQVAPHIVCGA